ncbi:MAG: hypothetical protein QME41_06785 [Actinomycetota bacterium]|nr:hypothetical protein [Actinomycetota bacterium]
MITIDIETNLRRYLDGAMASSGRKPDVRYASFDYCFNYFQSFRESESISELASPANIQLSCLQLGFYLASWGMLRGSAELLQKSARHFVPVIKAITSTEPSLWELDANCYTESNIERLLKQAYTIRHANGGMSDILVTKVMLGVFGNVPAFGNNFKRGFGVATFGAKALKKIAAFYNDNAEVIDKYRVPTLDFVSGAPTRRCYTRAKVIDMVFFIEGMS